MQSRPIKSWGIITASCSAGQTWWERDPDTGEYYTQDTFGVYWSWNDWEAAQQHAFFTEDKQRELSEAYLCSLRR